MLKIQSCSYVSPLLVLGSIGCGEDNPRSVDLFDAATVNTQLANNLTYFRDPNKVDKP